MVSDSWIGTQWCQTVGLAQLDLHCTERQCLGDKEARELKITRKVEGTNRLGKTEVSRSWKSQ